ncbi:hypothetical protein SADUNF_Sadunf14G0028400 [Salix dunnii]|uniref:Uncharacterized protein n=1 Tax=Salix dunnii TaxID=1413687 RepID=A0A835MPK0_9ROSI|nr:hypothetical protein SADUNF_Sadunf14G0028400 [Salix dunnii]
MADPASYSKPHFPLKELHSSKPLTKTNGSENLTGFDDKNVYQNWNSQYYRGEAMVYDANGHEMNKTGTQYSRGEYTVDVANGNERNKDGCLDAENGFENSFENADSNVVQAWNSQYYQSESTVVVSQPNYSLGEYGNLGQANGYRPLGLPVRSLNPRVRNLDSSQYSNGSESGTSLSGSGSGSADDSGRSVKENDFVDMGPTNLEGMFDETVALPSQTPWRSRFETNEIRDKVGSSAGGYSHFKPLSVDETQFESLKSQPFRSTTSLSSQGDPGPQHHGPSHFRSLPVDETQFESLKSQFFRSSTSLSQGNPGPQHPGPTHFRPLSVDETQFDSLKSQSFRSTTSLSSQGSSASYSPTTLSPSRSFSSEMPNSETEELGENKSYRASYPPTSQSPATRKADAPLNAFHLRRYSSGSLFQKDSQRSSRDVLKDLKGKRNEDTVGSRQAEQGSLRSDQKPAAPVKISSLKGKSVRTIRASRYAAETLKAGEMSQSHIVDKVGKICDEAQTVNIGSNEKERGPDNMLLGADKKNSDTRHPMSKPTLSKYKMKENEIFSESVAVASTEDSQSENDISRVNSDEDSAPATNNDAGDYSSEVDKKAGEFIAKFREQIRLQKVASIERSKGKRMNDTIYSSHGIVKYEYPPLDNTVKDLRSSCDIILQPSSYPALLVSISSVAQA